MRILFTDSKPYDREFFDSANRKYKFDIDYAEARLSAATAHLAAGHEVVCSFVNDRIDSETVDVLAAEGVRLLALRCSGYNNVDFKSCFDRIHVCRVPSYSPHAVAEHAVAMLLSINRCIPRAAARTRDGNFRLDGLLGFDLFGKTVGVVGTGRIGRIVAGILRGIGMNVLCHDEYVDEKWAGEAGVKYVKLDELFRESKVISLHCPLTPATHHLLDADAFASMQDGVFIVNTGRGPLIDSRALIDALKKRKIGGAALDVYEEEERYFFEDFSNEGISDDVLARLLSFPNVLVTAHQAFFTREALSAIAETTLGNIATFANGENPVRNEICYQCLANPCKATDGRHPAGRACF